MPEAIKELINIMNETDNKEIKTIIELLLMHDQELYFIKEQLNKD